MPAAAVIPAPIAYTNVVAVKKLVVGFQIFLCVPFKGSSKISSLTKEFLVLIYWVLRLSLLL